MTTTGETTSLDTTSTGDTTTGQPQICGNGIVEVGEQCDDGGESPDCDPNCTVAECGDLYINLSAGELCDDGNKVDTDACTTPLCHPFTCGDGFVYIGVEECDDGNGQNSDGCKNDCTLAMCGDGVVNIGVETCDGMGETASCDGDCTTALCGDGHLNTMASEQCDDGNLASGDGCSATCAVEQGECGGKFSLGWCLQNGTAGQYTRCESVANNGATCNNPFIKYGTAESGVPSSHAGNNFVTWCSQLGFAGFSDQVSYGSRPCSAPQGRVFGCNGYDENNWHWCDWQDGYWLNQSLNYPNCNDGQQIVSITCQK